ncbi:MAG: exosortase/archaeosortase family protein [Lentisphaeria bacterium]|nr:exosortase/archaeosortase family protein [Lentisphaeria bacterium]
MTDSVDTHYPAAPETRAAIPGHVWARIAVIGALFVWLHMQILNTLGAIAMRDPDWSHSFLVPIFSVYFMYHYRAELLAERPTGSWLGLPVFLAGLIGYFLAVYPVQSIMLRGWMAILELLGICLLLLGPRMMRWVWFPVCYLAFGVKFSGRIWNVVAWRLQLIAAQSSVILLNIFGLDAEVRGATIELWRGVDYLGALNVAEACSGLRMLVAFTALGFAIVYLVPRPLWIRVFLLVLTVPIAVAVNVVRVTITGFLHLISPDLSAGDFHVLVGMLMVFPAVAMFLGVGWVLDNLFIVVEAEDGEPEEDTA